MARDWRSWLDDDNHEALQLKQLVVEDYLIDELVAYQELANDGG